MLTVPLPSLFCHKSRSTVLLDLTYSSQHYVVYDVGSKQQSGTYCTHIIKSSQGTMQFLPVNKTS